MQTFWRSQFSRTCKQSISFFIFAKCITQHKLGACKYIYVMTLRWRHNEPDGVSNHQPPDCLLNLLFRRRSMKTSKLRVTGLCAGNSITGEFPAQRASRATMFPFDDVIMMGVASVTSFSYITYWMSSSFIRGLIADKNKIHRILCFLHG